MPTLAIPTLLLSVAVLVVALALSLFLNVRLAIRYYLATRKLQFEQGLNRHRLQALADGRLRQAMELREAIRVFQIRYWQLRKHSREQEV